MTTEQLQAESALSLLGRAKADVTTAAKILTMRGETDQASMKTLAVLDALDVARAEVELRGKAGA